MGIKPGKVIRCMFLRVVTFTWRSRELSCWLKKWSWLISGNLAIWTVHVLKKYHFNVFAFLERWILAFVANSETDVSVVFWPPCWSPSGWVPEWRLHTISNISLGKIFIRISCSRNVAVTWILVKAFAYLPSQFFCQIVDSNYLLNGFEFYFDLFWMA